MSCMYIPLAGAWVVCDENSSYENIVARASQAEGSEGSSSDTIEGDVDDKRHG